VNGNGYGQLYANYITDSSGMTVFPVFKNPANATSIGELSTYWKDGDGWTKNFGFSYYSINNNNKTLVLNVPSIITVTGKILFAGSLNPAPTTVQWTGGLRHCGAMEVSTGLDGSYNLLNVAAGIAKFGLKTSQPRGKTPPGWSLSVPNVNMNVTLASNFNIYVPPTISVTVLIKDSAGN